MYNVFANKETGVVWNIFQSVKKLIFYVKKILSDIFPQITETEKCHKYVVTGNINMF